MDETIDTHENAQADSPVETDFAVQASKMGWVPQDKFRGDQAKWVDAETYVKRGEEVLPIVKAELRKTREELAEVKKAAIEMQRFNEEATARKEAEWKARYDEAIQVKKDAIAQGDGEKVVEAEAVIDDLKASKPQPKQPEVKADPEFKSWLDENPWYGKDRTKTLKANMLGADLATDQEDGTPGLRGRALYDAVAKQLEAQERSSTGTNRSGPQRGGRVAASSKGVRSYENLQPEFRDACDKQFKFFGAKTTEEAWRKSWLEKATDEMFRS